MKKRPSRYPQKPKSRRPGWIARLFGTRRRWAPTEEQIRNRRRFAFGLLGLGLLIASMVGGVYLWQTTRSGVAELRQHADEAFAAGRYQEALDVYQQLADTADRDTLHALARCCEELEDEEQARQWMTRLADTGDRRGHLWLAKKHLAAKPLEPEDRNQVIQHLKAVLQEDPRSETARRNLARMYLSAGNTDAAIPHIQSLVADGHADKLDLALALFADKRQDDALRAAHDALAELTAKVQKDPGNLALRLRAKEAAMVLGDFAAAERLLLDGRKYAGDPRQLTLSLSQLYAVWAQRIRRGDESAALNLLARSASFKPVSSATLTALRDFCTGDSPQASVARSKLLQALVRNDAEQAYIHNLLAEVATRDRQPGEAQRHWKLASSSGPVQTVALNNLAVSLLLQSPPNPQLALSLVERAIELNPKDPQLQATRGRVLLRLGRWAEARDQLNAVLGPLESNPVVQLDLAEACLRTAFPERARGSLDSALRLNPQLHLEVALVAARSGNRQAADYLDRAVNYYKGLVTDNPQNLGARIAWAQSLILSNKFDEAEAVLTAASEPNEPRLRETLASLHVARAASADSDNPSLTSILKALEVDPNNRQALALLIDLSESGPQAKQARAALDERMASNPSAELLVLLGTRRWMDDRKHGRQLLEQAYALDPNAPDLRNNLAWALIHSPPIEAQRALKLVNLALDHSPHHPNYRGTRGHVLAQLQRWSEAKEDLQYALQFQPDHEENRAMLAQVEAELQQADVTQRR